MWSDVVAKGGKKALDRDEEDAYSTSGTSVESEQLNLFPRDYESVWTPKDLLRLKDREERIARYAQSMEGKLEARGEAEKGARVERWLVEVGGAVEI